MSKYIKMTWGFAGETRTCVLSRIDASKIEERSGALKSDPNYIWIFEKPSQEEIEEVERNEGGLLYIEL